MRFVILDTLWWLVRSSAFLLFSSFRLMSKYWFSPSLIRCFWWCCFQLVVGWLVLAWSEIGLPLRNLTLIKRQISTGSPKHISCCFEWLHFWPIRAHRALKLGSQVWGPPDSNYPRFYEQITIISERYRMAPILNAHELGGGGNSIVKRQTSNVTRQTSDDWCVDEKHQVWCMT